MGLLARFSRGASSFPSFDLFTRGTSKLKNRTDTMFSFRSTFRGHFFRSFEVPIISEKIPIPTLSFSLSIHFSFFFSIASLCREIEKLARRKSLGGGKLGGIPGEY